MARPQIAMAHVASLICEGVFEKFPTLQFLFVEHERVVSETMPVVPHGTRPVFGVEDDRPLSVVDGRCVLCPVEEIPPGTRRIFAFGGARGIGVFNVGGEFFAVRNVCPHKGGPLCRGRLRPHVVGPEVNRIAFEREGEILKCPWHQWEFDIRTVWSLYAPRLRVKTYPVSVEDGRVVVVLEE
jgi:nitrite reductase/ring-hydroxylating ferredoxin subunit